MLDYRCETRYLLFTIVFTTIVQQNKALRNLKKNTITLTIDDWLI